MIIHIQYITDELPKYHELKSNTEIVTGGKMILLKMNTNFDGIVLYSAIHGIVTSLRLFFGK